MPDRICNALLLIGAIICAQFAHAQADLSTALHGVVKNKRTNEPIPRASVMIIGSSRGAIANSQGRYTINLEKDHSYKLRIRAIGFREDTVVVMIAERTNRDIVLDEQPVTGKEVVVRGDASRVEARRIMREVIRRKKMWIDKLSDYTSKAYSRWNYKTISGGEDSVVRSVIESIADVYWKRGKGIAERIVARKQTANLPPELNSFSVGEVVNFYDERVDFGEYNLPTPLAEDAFDTYDYDLVEKDVTVFGGTYSVILVESGPLSPGFIGKLWVDESDYSVGYLELEPNSAVQLGPMNLLRFEQRFDDIEGEYQLPIDLHMIVGIKLQLPFVPQIEFEQLSVLKEYSVNVGVHDSLYESRRHSALPNADSVDAKTWEVERAIPLTDEEEGAYKRIDSTMAVSREDTATSFWGTALEALPSPEIPAFNQVEGLRLGISKEFQPVKTFPFSLEGNLRYGIEDKAFKYRLRAEQGIRWTLRKRVMVSGGLSGDISGEFREEPEVTLSIGADLFDTYHERGTIYSSVLTSITSLIYGEDYQEFYRGRGYSLDLNYYPFSRSTASIAYTSQKITDVGDLHIVSDTASNPSMQYTAVSAKVNTAIDLSGLDIKLDIDYVTSSKSFSSDYEFSTVELGLGTYARLGGLGRVELTGRYSTALSGDLPRWNLFLFETRNKFFFSSSHFRALEPFEFMGDELWMLYAEHNFYDLLTRLIGIESSDYFDPHWFVFGGIGATDFRRTALPGVHTTHDRPHGEIGFGIGNLFNILRLEGTWRLTHKKETNFYPALSLGFAF